MGKLAPNTPNFFFCLSGKFHLKNLNQTFPLGIPKLIPNTREIFHFCHERNWNGPATGQTKILPFGKRTRKKKTRNTHVIKIEPQNPKRKILIGKTLNDLIFKFLENTQEPTNCKMHVEPRSVCNLNYQDINNEKKTINQEIA